MSKRIISTHTISLIRRLRDTCDKREKEASKRAERSLKLKQKDLLTINLFDSALLT